MRLDDLADLVRQEHEESVAFRDEVREKIGEIKGEYVSFREEVQSALGDIHQWAAVREAKDEESARITKKLLAAFAWLIATIIAVASIAIPLLHK